jgi:GNAT superfamily N-acetyltransferase
MPSFAAKIINYQRENGTKQLIRACWIRLKNSLFFYNKEVVGCLSVLDPIPCAHPKISVTIRTAEISDVPELKLLTAGYKKRDFLQWIKEKYIFHIAQLNDSASPIPDDGELHADSPTFQQPSGFDKKIIGYVCVCPANKYKHKLVSMLKLKDTDYWAVDAYIHPTYRGKGINSAIAYEFLAQARREGFKRGYGTILFNNNSSRRSYASIGEKEIGVFTTITILGLTYYSLKKNKGYEEFYS